MPIEPPACRWVLPPAARPLLGEIAGVGADLEPGTLLAAYRSGLFPMRLEGLRGPLGWWSPNPRGVFPVGGLHVSRSLQRTRRRFDIRIDTAFGAVVEKCAAAHRPGRWIGEDIKHAFGELHRLGWAHSVEAWRDGSLVGGVYGVAIGGLFAGESMFHLERDASKAALAALDDLLAEDGDKRRLFDVQWCTPHLASLGCVEMSRRKYLKQLAIALRLPLPQAFDGLR